MACSRSVVRPSDILAAVLCLSLVAVLAFAPAGVADGRASLDDRVVESVNIAQVRAGAFGLDAVAATGGVSDGMTVPRFCPTVLSATCDPARIETGVDCGMDWMCGIAPCLCGSADNWGGCSCNGLAETVPTVQYASSDEDVIRVVEALGQTWLVPVGAGTATLTCSASLKYYDDTAAEVSVTVAGPTLADGVLLAVAVVAVAVLAAAALGVRAVARKVRGRMVEDAADGSERGKRRWGLFR